MKSFEELYNEFQNNQGIINAAQEAKIATRKRNKIFWSIFLTINLILIIFILLKAKDSDIIILVAPFIFFTDFFVLILSFIIISVAFPNKKLSEYKKLFKEQIIKGLISNFFDDVKYFPEQEMTEEEYDDGEYKEYYNRYWADDYIKAKIDGKYDITMAEVLTEHETTDSDGDTHTETVFHGIYSKIKIDKSINSDLRISTNYQRGYSNRLEMDSSEFEKKFEVYASDKIIGMQILTADIMEELLNFKNKVKYYFDIFIKKNTIYIRFHCGAMFEAKTMKKDKLDEKSIKIYYDVLEFINEFINRLIKIINEVEI